MPAGPMERARIPLKYEESTCANDSETVKEIRTHTATEVVRAGIKKDGIMELGRKDEKEEYFMHENTTHNAIWQAHEQF
jgi:hypothetical protein